MTDLRADLIRRHSSGAISELAPVLDSTSHPLRLTVVHLFLAMAHQRPGHIAEARRQLDAGWKRLEGLGRAHYLHFEHVYFLLI
jgi:hypothetical protein